MAASFLAFCQHSSQEGPLSRGMMCVPVRSLRVLLLEDDRLLSNILSSAIQTRGHECTAVRTVAQALGAVGAREFDVVVSDRHVSGGGGAVVLRVVTARSPKTKRILMSGALSSDKSDAACSHVYLIKPFELDELFEALER